jgi:hypothetical protein
MKLRIGSPFSKSEAPKLERIEERVAFNTAAQEPVEVEAAPEIPKLVETKKETANPPLQPVQRTRKVIELSPPQPVAETSAAAEPVKTGGGQQSEAAWPFKQNGNIHASDSKRDDDGPKPDSTVYYNDSVGTNKHDVGAAESNVDGSGNGSGGEEEGASAKNTAAESIPRLVQVEKEAKVIPKLELRRDGGAAPANEIPQLTAYNTMEVVHLLLGRSVEDEEVVLLQTFSERFIRSKKSDEFKISLRHRIGAHIQRMLTDGNYDFRERQALRNVQFPDIGPVFKSRGVEWFAAYEDNGGITNEEIAEYATNNVITQQLALNELVQAGYKRDPHFVYTWALVKVKIGHDFGAYKLSELMPTL